MKSRKALLWAATIFTALVIGVSGLSTLMTTGEWDKRFPSWGYPAWPVTVVGVTEIVGAVLVCVPRLARYFAIVLATIMAGATVTLLAH